MPFWYNLRQSLEVENKTTFIPTAMQCLLLVLLHWILNWMMDKILIKFFNHNVNLNFVSLETQEPKGRSGFIHLSGEILKKTVIYYTFLCYSTTPKLNDNLISDLGMKSNKCAQYSVSTFTFLYSNNENKTFIPNCPPERLPRNGEGNQSQVTGSIKS